MAFTFGRFEEGGPGEAFVDWLIDEQSPVIGEHFNRLWDYYQNPCIDLGQAGVLRDKANETSRDYVQAQEVGLPSRITGIERFGPGGVQRGRAVQKTQRKEVVIENDIAWRINAMVDFLFGKGFKLVSKSPEAAKRREIEEILLAVISANGGAGFFQDMAVLGSVYGFVDCVLRPSLGGSASVPVGSSDAALLPAGQSGRGSSFASILRLASSLGLELIEAPRALPVLDENDYRRIRYYLQHFAQQKNQVRAEGRFLSRLLNGFTSSGTDRRESVAVTEVIGPRWWQRYEDKELIAEGPNILSEVPVVHIQNLAQPYFYEGLSDVEQLIPLQDELNTRLSDRASRITLQTFRMYLAKGLDDFTDQPIGPGQMWSASNPDATIEAFGGDTPAPGEDKHIAEIREAMDKVSGVTPVVAGVLKNKLGNLTSGVALKMTFMGMLAKTVRKQHTYGEGIKEIGRMVLRLLDVCGVYPTEEQDRELKVIFPNPLPTDEMDRLEEARIKIELGVPREKVLQELGY